MQNDTDKFEPSQLSNYRPVVGRSILATLEQNWRRVSGEHGVPNRRSITPDVLGAALPYTFIAERIAPGQVRMRVAGRRLSELAGMEARGLPLSVLMDVTSRDVLAERVEQVFEMPALADMPIRVPRKGFRKAVQGRMILMPLCNDNGEISRILGAILLDGPIGHRPGKCEILADDSWRFVPITVSNESEKTAQPYGLRPSERKLRLVVNNG